MKNLAKKILCIIMVVLLVLPLDGSIIANTYNEPAASVYVYCGDYVSIYDLPLATGEWREDGAVQEVDSFSSILDDLSMTEYEVFRATGMTLAEFLALREAGVTLAEMRTDELAYYRSWAYYYDLPIVYGEWLEYGETQEALGVTVWACPDEEKYYLTYGRLRNLADYLSMTEYEVFRATGMRFPEFQALRESGTTLAQLRTMATSHEMMMDGLAYYGSWVYYYDLPIVWGEWLEEGELLEHDALLHYIEPMSVSLPTLELARGATTSTSVTLTGTIVNNGGAPITARGFWIRRIDAATEREYLTSSSGSTFTMTLTGLTPGATYIARAIARNSGAAGTGQSNPITFITINIPPPADPPGPPQGLSATPGANQITLNWLAPASNGGAVITRYETAVNNGPWVTADSMTSHTFRGLTAGQHTLRVRAVNAVGASQPASITASPSAAVSLPTLTATRGATTSTTVEVSGTITSTGGAPITARGFWIRRSDQTTEREELVSTTSSTFTTTLTGLTPNSTYHVRAIARNSGASGTGQSNLLTFTTPAGTTPVNPPGAPTGLDTTSGVNQVTLNWLAPANNGGAAIVRYEVAINNGPWLTAQSMTSHTFTSLAPGQHTFRVRAVNSAGAGPQANITASPIASNLPTLTVGRGTTTSTTVELTGTITGTGGAPITARGFWIRRDDELTHNEVLVSTTGNTFTTTLTNLTPNSTYHVRAIARNSINADTGQSDVITFVTPASTTPATPPGAPTGLTTTSVVNEVTLNWLAPANNGGAAIVRYEVALNNGPWLMAQSMTSHTFTSWAAGQNTFRVRAVNSAGAGPQASITLPGAPLVSATRGVNQVIINWSTPISISGAAPASYNIEALSAVITTHYQVSSDGGVTWVMAQGSASHTFANLTAGQHTFVVRPVSPIGAGIPASTTSSPVILPSLTVSAGTSTRTSVTLNAAVTDPGSEPITQHGFWIRRHGETTGRYVNVATSDGTFTTTIPNLTPGATYHVRSFARNIFGTGSSNEITVETLPLVMPPPNFTATPNFTTTPIGTSVDLRWNIPIDLQGPGIRGFRVSVNGGAWVPTDHVTSHFVGGLPFGLHTFRVKAVTADGYGAYASATARLAPGIAVTVRNRFGHPIEGALVHFLRGTNPWAGVETYIETCHNGIAFFANAPTGRYGVMVSHDDFITTSETIRDFRHDNANQVNHEPFVMREYSSTFRNLNWAHMLANVGTVANPTYRVSSIYGYREWSARAFSRHSGIDIVAIDGNSLGRRLNAPFTGEVVTIFEQQVGGPAGRGHGITMLRKCDDTLTYFYVSYYHMQHVPAFEEGDSVTREQQVGAVGGTPYETFTRTDGTSGTRPRAIHLHVEVHRNFDHGHGPFSWEHLMDPRAFWTPNIFRPRHHGSTIHRGTTLVGLAAISHDELLPDYFDADLGEEIPQ